MSMTKQEEAEFCLMNLKFNEADIDRSDVGTLYLNPSGVIKVLKTLQNYCEEENIKQVVEGELPRNKMSMASKLLYATADEARKSIIKWHKQSLKPVSLVDSTDCNEQIEHRYTGVLDFPRQGNP